MPPAAKQRYRVYSVEEFLDDRFGVEQPERLATFNRAAGTHARAAARQRAALLRGAAVRRRSRRSVRSPERSCYGSRRRRRADDRCVTVAHAHAPSCATRSVARRRSGSAARASTQALAGSSVDLTPAKRARFARRRGPLALASECVAAARRRRGARAGTRSAERLRTGSRAGGRGRRGCRARLAGVRL